MRHITTMTIDDALHYSEIEREQIISSYLPHEREARANGIPVLGSGRIFTVPEEDIKCDVFDIPKHFVHLGGIEVVDVAAADDACLERRQVDGIAPV